MNIEDISNKIFDDSEKFEKNLKIQVEDATENFQKNYKSIVLNFQTYTNKYRNFDDKLVEDFVNFIKYI